MRERLDGRLGSVGSTVDKILKMRGYESIYRRKL